MFFAEFGAQSPHMHIDGAGATVILVSPDSIQKCLASKDLARVGGEESEEFVFHVGEVERATSDRGLIGLDVEEQWSVFEKFRSGAATGSPEKVPKAGFELAGVRWVNDEIVEELVSVVELVKLGPRHDGQKGRYGDVAFAEFAAKRPCAFGVVDYGDDCGRPSVLWLDGAALGRALDGLPAVAR